jgi:hypothetical protein
VGPLVGVGDVEVGRTELALERWLLVVQAAHACVISPHVRSIKSTETHIVNVNGNGALTYREESV